MNYGHIVPMRYELRGVQAISAALTDLHTRAMALIGEVFDLHTASAAPAHYQIILTLASGVMPGIDLAFHHYAIEFRLRVVHAAVKGDESVRVMFLEPTAARVTPNSALPGGREEWPLAPGLFFDKMGNAYRNAQADRSLTSQGSQAFLQHVYDTLFSAIFSEQDARD